MCNTSMVYNVATFTQCLEFESVCTYSLIINQKRYIVCLSQLFYAEIGQNFILEYRVYFFVKPKNIVHSDRKLLRQPY